VLTSHSSNASTCVPSKINSPLTISLDIEMQTPKLVDYKSLVPVLKNKRGCRGVIEATFLTRNQAKQN